MLTTLGQLKMNDEGIIESFLDQDFALSIINMGFVIGNKVRVNRIAPLGDPILISSGANSVSIRKADADLITIKKL